MIPVIPVEIFIEVEENEKKEKLTDKIFGNFVIIRRTVV